MSIRHLDHLFSPRSVAVVGVSARDGNLGAIVLRNLRQAGFAGPLWAVDIRGGEVDGIDVWAGVDALPGVPDLASCARRRRRCPASSTTSAARARAPPS